MCPGFDVGARAETSEVDSEVADGKKHLLHTCSLLFECKNESIQRNPEEHTTKITSICLHVNEYSENSFQHTKDK